MEIQQIFNPFDFTVSKGGSNIGLILLGLVVLAVIGYFLLKDKFADGKTAFS